MSGEENQQRRRRKMGYQPGKNLKPLPPTPGTSQDQQESRQSVDDLINEGEGKTRELPHQDINTWRPGTALDIPRYGRRTENRVCFFAGAPSNNETDNQQASCPLAPTTCGQ